MSIPYKDIKDLSSQQCFEILYKKIIESGGAVSLQFLADEVRRKE